MKTNLSESMVACVRVRLAIGGREPNNDANIPPTLTGETFSPFPIICAALAALWSILSSRTYLNNWTVVEKLFTPVKHVIGASVVNHRAHRARHEFANVSTLICWRLPQPTAQPPDSRDLGVKAQHHNRWRGSVSVAFFKSSTTTDAKWVRWWWWR